MAWQFDEAVELLVSYGAPHIESVDGLPYLPHAVDKFMDEINSLKIRSSGSVRPYRYPEAEPLFVIPAHESYRANLASMAHTRTLTFLKERQIGTVRFGFEKIWNKHTESGFTERSVEGIMVNGCSLPNPPAW